MFLFTDRPAAPRLQGRDGGLQLTLFTDGACRGNPGPAGIGFVILDPSGAELQAVSQAIGRATNNVAEYTALIRGLERCRDLGGTSIEVVSDSELLVRQMLGRYQVKNPRLKPLFEQAKSLAEGFEQVTYRHTLREGNQRADGLAGAALRGR